MKPLPVDPRLSLCTDPDGESLRPLVGETDPDIRRALLAYTSEKNIELYPAQEKPSSSFSQGNIILNTPTGSGKSLALRRSIFYPRRRDANPSHLPD